MWNEINKDLRYEIIFKKRTTYHLQIYRNVISENFKISCPEFNLKTTKLKTNDIEEAKKVAIELLRNKIQKKIDNYNDVLDKIKDL